MQLMFVPVPSILLAKLVNEYAIVSFFLSFFAFNQILLFDAININWASARESLSLGFVNNNSADQPEFLISTFVIRIWESNISRLATNETSII